MSQNIEIEFKNLLTETEFTLLKDYLNMDESQFFKQENHYFDTVQFALKEHGCALRVREKDGQYELTLKEPHSEGLLETNQSLSSKEVKTMLEKHIIIDGPVKDRLRQFHIPLGEMTYFGSLTTKRAEKEYEGGLIVLDYSTYLNHFDYEVEYEVTDFQLGKEVFEKLLTQLKIPIRKTENKIRRFYNAKWKLI